MVGQLFKLMTSAESPIPSEKTQSASFSARLRSPSAGETSSEEFIEGTYFEVFPQAVY